MTQKAPLREAYEKALGTEISDRQWRRIKNEYLEGKANLKTVRSLALLRRTNGRVAVTLQEVQRFEGLEEFAQSIEGWVQGSDLLAAFGKLNPVPSDRTIRRWGHEIDVPLSKDEWYSPEQTQKWIKKLASQARFKFPQQQKGA